MKFKAFTLAELLIALAVLGVIATFTIPKVLQAQTDVKYRSMAKETMAMASESYQAYKMNNVPSATTKPPDLTAYMNYARVDTVSQMDSGWGSLTIQCSSGEPCLRLHNGAVLFCRYMTFSGTANTNAISFYFDPDGKVTDSSTNGPGKSLRFFIYFDGKLKDNDNLLSGTTDSNTTYGVNPHHNPDWFSWN